MCSETCVGRIRYLGVVLYDADRIEEAASAKSEQDLYEAQLSIFLDPNDPKVIEQARADGMPENWLEGARRSPIWKMAMEWKVAFPLHPEYRTLPMVWYVPPLSPIQSAAEAGKIGHDGEMPDVRSLAHSAEISRQSADRRQGRAGRARPRTHAGDARLYAREDGRRRDRRSHRQARRPHRAGDRGHVSDHGDRQLRGSLRHPDRASRNQRRRLRPARLVRLLVRQRLLGRHRAKPICSARPSAPRRRWRSCDDQGIEGALRAADLSHRRIATGGGRDQRGDRKRAAHCRWRYATNCTGC